MEKILVIDDEPVIRVLLRQLFEKRSYTVFEASDGAEGLDLYRKENPDVVVTDLIMPEEEGLSVIKKIKKIKPDANIIAISGGGLGSAEVYLKLAKSMGAQYVFQKPFDDKEMLSTVENMLTHD